MSEQPQLISLEESFIKYLVDEAQYPRDSLIKECALPTNTKAPRYLDLAVIDVEASRLIGLFEFISSINEDATNIVATKFKLLVPDLEMLIPSYLVTSSTSGAFEVYHLDSAGKWQRLSLSSLPTYDALRSAGKAKTLLHNQKKTKQTLNWFALFCYLLAIALFVFITLSFKLQITISPEQLVLIGLMCAFVVVPHAAKLKFLGIEFDRMRSLDEDSE